VELAFIRVRITCLTLASTLKLVLAFRIFKNKIWIRVSNSWVAGACSVLSVYSFLLIFGDDTGMKGLLSSAMSVSMVGEEKRDSFYKGMHSKHSTEETAPVKLTTSQYYKHRG